MECIAHSLLNINLTTKCPLMIIVEYKRRAAVATETVHSDTIRPEEDIIYGHERPKPLAHPTKFGGPPNLHPDDHDFDTCRPPTIVGNPSNKHNMVFGDNRIPGSYGRSTTHRDTYKGP
eukprot:scaffold189754_cov31-Prasinocladus_malaysianus.AAC.1